MSKKEKFTESEQRLKIRKNIDRVMPYAVTAGGITMSALSLMTNKPDSDVVFWVGVWLALSGVGAIATDCIAKKKNQNNQKGR